MDARLTLSGHVSDLGGGFVVRRLLPAGKRQSVGPFIFFDHFGPLVQQPDAQTDVRPHPHIGLATVTYLFEGAMMHRDSLGSVQRIEPGAINWMTAGSGIALAVPGCATGCRLQPGSARLGAGDGGLCCGAGLEAR